MGHQDTESENFGPGSDDPLAPGERQREGYKIFALHKELGFSDSPSVIGQDVSESDSGTNSARRWHTCGGRRIEGPRGGHRRLPNFGKAFGAIYASVVCTDGCTDDCLLLLAFACFGFFGCMAHVAELLMISNDV